MNINANEFLKNVMKSFGADFGSFDYKKMVDAQLKNESLFGNDYSNLGSLENTSIFNLGKQGVSATNKTQQAKAQTYEQYSQKATQLLANMDSAFKTLEDNGKADTEKFDNAAVAETRATVAALDFADEIEEAAKSAKGEEKTKLMNLASQIKAKCEARDAKRVAIVKDWCKTADASVIRIKNPEDVISEIKTASTEEQIAKLESTKAEYKAEYKRAMSHLPNGDEDGGAKAFVDKALAKIDARINELKPSNEDKKE